MHNQGKIRVENLKILGRPFRQVHKNIWVPFTGYRISNIAFLTQNTTLSNDIKLLTWTINSFG
jgi:hypothetical protein